MAETLAGVPESCNPPLPLSETPDEMDPETYGEWIGSDDGASGAFLDAEETRFIGPASENAAPAAPFNPSSSMTVAHNEFMEEGSFISPQQAKTTRREAAQSAQAVQEAAQAAHVAQVAARHSKSPADVSPTPVPLQSDLLARIAGELRSIKTELVGLKDHFAEEPVPTTDLVQTAEAAPAKQDIQDMPDTQDRQGSPETTDTASGTQSPEPVSPEELRSLLAYLDRLLESLPEEKIEEFARSEYFDLYRSVFDKLGLV